MQISWRNLLLTLSIAASVAYYLSTAQVIPLPFEIVCKGLAVSALAAIALVERRSVLAAALLACSLGDVLLNLGAAYFLPGLGAFLTGHLIYAVLFLKQARQTTRAAAQWAWPVLAAVYAIALGTWLSPALGDLRAPVFCYTAAIALMVSAAGLAGYRSRWVAAGAVLFLISDSILGAAKFRQPIPFSGFLVWTTYYVGQCGIALGVLAEYRGSGRPA
jgi:uncharacterized membrane protein YhhN